MKNNLKNRFSYWLDKQMSKGTISIIRLLSFTVISFVIFISVLIMLFKLRDTFFSAFWDSFATIINAWMPSSDDGEVGYIILNTFTAVVGLLFTSILIGVISSGIEEKIEELRKGNSYVLEKGHTVILGYNLGEHGLLKQLVLASGKRKRCIVIFTDIEKPEIEQDIANNIDVPDNVTILCRHGDITNVNDLRCCSINTADLLIVNAMNDNRRIKAILATSALLKEYPESPIRIISCVTNDKYLLPKRKIIDKNMIMLKTDDSMAKIIAHTATEPGLSIAFKEMLNFEENEFYFEKDLNFIGKSVLEITKTLDKAALAGIRHNDKITINPKRDYTVNINDELILFEQEKGSYVLHRLETKRVEDRLPPSTIEESKGKVVIIGHNTLSQTILDELHKDIKDVCIYTDKDDANELDQRQNKRDIEIRGTAPEKELSKIAENYQHIILLSDRDIDKEDSDISTILLLLKLMDIRDRKGLDFNLVVELNLESSYNVAPKTNYVDYIVNSNTASLFLAQIAENPHIEQVFKELLTNKGNELYSKPIRIFNLHTRHDYSVIGLKEIVLSYGYTLLRIMHGNEIDMNPGLSERVQFETEDRLIVLGRE